MHRLSRLWTFLGAAILPGAGVAQEILYATSAAVNPNLLTVDRVTGAVLDSVAITGEEALFGGLTHDGTALWSIDGFNDAASDRTFRIDPDSGAGTVVGDTGFNWNFRSVEIDPVTRVLYATTDNVLYTVDPSTGAAALVASMSGPTLDQATAIAIDRDGQAYVTDIGGTGLFELDLDRGLLTHLGDLDVGALFQDLAFDRADQLLGVAGSPLGGVYTIDVDAVSATLAFPSGLWAGLSQDAEFLFADGFESGDTSAWSTTVP